MTETEKMFSGKMYDPFTEGMPEARRRAHALEDEVLGGARRIAVPKRLPQNSFGCGVIGRGCTADGDVGGKESF